MECPQVGRGGVFRQITSNLFQTRSSIIALYISYLNGKKVLWQSLWLDLCTKQVVSAHISFCPITLQVLIYLAR